MTSVVWQATEVNKPADISSTAVQARPRVMGVEGARGESGASFSAIYQDGWLSSEKLLVRRVWSLPSEFITNISPGP